MLHWFSFAGGRSVRVFLIILLFLVVCQVSAQIEPDDVLLLVNENSPASRYIASLYREYHPGVPEAQLVYLSGLPDSCGPNSTEIDEIISREDYTNLIADPIRNYLEANDLITSIKVIITTAGIPYRIEDTDYLSVIQPAASNSNTVLYNTGYINAASVESELTCLWYSDINSNSFGLSNRIVNPYQAYINSNFTLFDRLLPDTKSMIWNYAISLTGISPKMEGEFPRTWPINYGTINRNFSAGDIYLTCRLDGPKTKGNNPIPAVRAILERAKRASSFDWGVNPLQAVAVLDDSPNKRYDQNRVFNLDRSASFWLYSDENQIPDAPTITVHDDYASAYYMMTGQDIDYNGLNVGLVQDGPNVCAIVDQREFSKTSQVDLDSIITFFPERTQPQGIIFWASYGKNGDEAESDFENYHADGSPLFKVLNGAVMTSVESFNAVTMFSDIETVQGKIVDFVTYGGCGAIGHCFEPLSSAVIDNEFFVYNLLADTDFDNIADLTFIEAAYTSIPFLSWSEVVIGDPLMRIRYSSDATGFAWNDVKGDTNLDGQIDIQDVMNVVRAKYGNLYSDDPEVFGRYNDLCDINKDGLINLSDIRLVSKIRRGIPVE